MLRLALRATTAPRAGHARHLLPLRYTFSPTFPTPFLNNQRADPAESLDPPKDYYDRVAKVHVEGGYGSTGYRAPWSHAESKKLLLRTHTTASSAAMLYQLAARCRGEAPLDQAADLAHEHGAAKPQEESKKGDDGFRPAKLFSIDRVFRNETMDATHLAEFHQVEGVVADRDLTLADLIGGLLWFAR